MNEPTPYGRTTGHETAAVQVHTPTPLAPTHTVPLAPAHSLMQPGTIPAVASVVLPDGRVVTGYAVTPMQPEPIAAKPALSRAAVNIALGGVGVLAVCGGLLLLTTFITALAALITQLITLAAVVFGGWIAVQIFGDRGHGEGGTTVNIRKAVMKRNKFYG